jgi:hypothetical protein
MRIKKKGTRKLGIIGKIKVGEIIQKGNKSFPTSLDYFRATSGVAQYVDIFEREYKKANIIPVMFGTDDDEFNTNHRYEIRDSTGKIYSYGDGEDYFVSMSDGFKKFDNAYILSKYGSVQSFLDKTEQYLHSSKVKAVWKEVLTLRFVIPGMPILGAWELRTMAAKSSIDQILGNYDLAKNINGGSIKGVPFFLRVRKVKSNRVLDRQRVYPVIALDQVLTEQARASDLLSGGNDFKLIEK